MHRYTPSHTVTYVTQALLEEEEAALAALRQAGVGGGELLYAEQPTAEAMVRALGRPTGAPLKKTAKGRADGKMGAAVAAAVGCEAAAAAGSEAAAAPSRGRGPGTGLGGGAVPTRTSMLSLPTVQVPSRPGVALRLRPARVCPENKPDPLMAFPWT